MVVEAGVSEVWDFLGYIVSLRQTWVVWGSVLKLEVSGIYYVTWLGVINTQTFWDGGNTSTLTVILGILSLGLKADEIIQSKELRSTLFYVLSLPRRMATQTHALSVNNKLSNMSSDMCNMKSTYWSVPVLLSSVLSESAVVSTPLRNSLFLRCQDCEQ